MPPDVVVRSFIVLYALLLFIIISRKREMMLGITLSIFIFSALELLTHTIEYDLKEDSITAPWLVWGTKYKFDNGPLCVRIYPSWIEVQGTHNGEKIDVHLFRGIYPIRFAEGEDMKYFWPDGALQCARQS